MTKAKRTCSVCGKTGHNARTCTHNPDANIRQTMVDLINEAMKSRSPIHPTLAIDSLGKLFIEGATEVTGKLALSFCRIYLNLPQNDCSGPPPGTLGKGGVQIVPN